MLGAILIDLFSQYTCTGSFSNSSGTSKQERLSQVIVFNGVSKVYW